MVGNYMNAGSKNEQTIGFEMAFLTKVGHSIVDVQQHSHRCMLYS